MRLPAEAKLTVNRRATRSTAATRTFVTPPLQPGKDFYYTLTAETVRDGQPVKATRQVAVRAGTKTQVVFDSLAPGVAQRQ